MRVDYVQERDDEAPRHLGRIGLWIEYEHSLDASVTLDQLLELRAEIDRFLFTRVKGDRT